MSYPIRRTRKGFTLVELFTVLAVIAILAGILLPAVQQAREAGRRTACAMQLKQQSLALLQFESAHRSLPPGATPDKFHSWASLILPFLEQTNLYRQLDFESQWNSTTNLASKSNLAIYHCPSSWKDYPGSTDYAGIRGSSHNATLRLGRNGLLFPVSQRHPAIKLSQISDGLSQTMVVAEAVALTEQSHGFWASGLNCIGHDDGPINNRRGSRDEIASLHPGGANAAFADGSTRFLSQSSPLRVIAALCTRSNAETVNEY